jgi:hypothetical protein
VGGFFDKEFSVATQALFERLKKEEVIFVVSDVLASWNFKHIVNLDRIKGYNGVNLKMGYSIVEIRNPKDLISYGND